MQPNPRLALSAQKILQRHKINQPHYYATTSNFALNEQRYVLPIYFLHGRDCHHRDRINQSFAGRRHRPWKRESVAGRYSWRRTTLTDEAIDKWLEDEANHETLNVKLPKGIKAAAANIYIPEDNPMTRAKIELGRQLYFDTRLSSDNTISCASCHHPDTGFGADTQFGVGVEDQTGNRNSPVSYNRIISKAQFWDGRADSLEDQAVGPIANAIEMGSNHEHCCTSVASIAGYKKQFEKIFDDGVNIDNIGKALAAFERALVTGPAPYDFYAPVHQFETAMADDLEDLDDDLQDRYDDLKEAAAKHKMSESAERGMKLFATKKANCTACHAGANFTDEQYHNLGVGMDADEPDWGRFDVTKEEKDKGAFKTPTLRNVAMSAPYMHDGSQKTLEEVVEWYDKGGHKNEWLSDKMKPLKLTDQEKKDLVAFMKEGLTGSFPKIEHGRLPDGGFTPYVAKAVEEKSKANEMLAEKPEVKAKEKTAEASATEMTQEQAAETEAKPEMKEAVAATVASIESAKKPDEAPKKQGFFGITCDANNQDVSTVKSVFDDSAAAAAGIKSGDVIVAINGKVTGSFPELQRVINGLSAGDELTIKYKRNGKTTETKAILKGLPK